MCSLAGLIFRLDEVSKTWEPGLMSKHSSGTKWVWKKHTVAQLDIKGIRITYARLPSK